MKNSPENGESRVPRLLPTGPQKRLSAFDVLSRLQNIDCEPFKEQRESAVSLSSGNTDLFDTMLGTIHVRHRRVENRLELHRIEMSPLTW